MAESIVTISIAKLRELLIQEPHLLRGADGDISSLIEELDRARRALARAEGDDAHTKDRADQLISLAYDAECAVDAHLYKRRRRTTSCVDPFSPRRLRRLRNRIDDIKKRTTAVFPADEFNTVIAPTDVGVIEPPTDTNDPPSFEEDEAVVGFDDDIEAIVARLVEGDDHARRSAVSIVGMGGLGKTTLASKAYKHARVAKRFGDKAWVTVSRHYRPKELLLVMLECLLGKQERVLMEMAEEDALKRKISDYLKQRRYLLVVDDIWRYEAWAFLNDFLPDSSNGSLVLLTTRDRDVAASVDATSPLYELQLLGEEKSWELLLKKAFPHLKGRCPKDYEEVGREIARKCGGLPLQLVVLGGLLREKKKRDDWYRVLTGVDWVLDMEDRTSRVLAHSYHDLPEHLKPCFLYLGVFPEDYEILSGRLVRLWVAEGFVNSMNAELEEAAEGYLEALVKRNLVMSVRRTFAGNVESCRVHDLLLELSVSKARDTGFLDVRKEENFEEQSAAHRARRIVSHSIIDEDTPSPDFKRASPEICSLIHCGTLHKLHRQYLAKDSIWEGLNLLRVVDVDLGYSPVKILPKGIGKMTLLRHLGLDWSGTHMRLPTSLGNLCNLQTLDLRIDSTIFVPASIWRLERLRHLLGKDLRIDGQPRIDRRYDLQTLSGVRDPPGWSKRCQLSRLTRLRAFEAEMIEISDEGPLAAALHEMKSLRSLELGLHEDWTELKKPIRKLYIFAEDPKTEDIEGQMAKLLVFQEHHELREMCLHGHIGALPRAPNCGFPPNLTKLYLTRSRLTRDSFARLERLPKLQLLTLSYRSYIEGELVFGGGGFAELESLEIDNLQKLEKWEVEEGAMPVLKTLVVTYCRMLKELPEGLQHVTSLKEMVLRSMSASFCGRVREGEGEDWWKVQHIPTITIKES
ncbi:Disease resistance protein RPP8 [Acorus gramineus]|uniref:Disease resistance protein RPP8 n=1 Tax=Acorus gramineus TaxID=55184 RepID=A0AAV9AW97_ACOGR|nr:Disease resistance protein RPP8 [Acorus gramineus]